MNTIYDFLDVLPVLESDLRPGQVLAAQRLAASSPSTRDGPALKRRHLRPTATSSRSPAKDQNQILINYFLLLATSLLDKSN
jgi:hypothetical protein